MASLKLRVFNDIYNYSLPDDLEEISVTRLKEEFKEKFKLLYHQKLRLSADDKQDAQLEDTAIVPQAPRIVRVQGPESVVRMLELGLKSIHRASHSGATVQQTTAPLHHPLPKASAPFAGRGAGRGLSSSSGTPNSGYFYGHGFTPSGRNDYGAPRYSPPGVGSNAALPLMNFQQGARVQVVGLQMRPELNGLYGTVIELDRTSNRWQVWLDGSSQAQLFKTENLVVAATQQTAMLQQEQQDIDLAIQASRMMLEADEEAQLAWALAESARVAEAEDTSDKRGTDSAGEKSSTREPTSTAVPCESDYDVGHGSEGSDEDDDLPPLLLLPNSEE